MSSEIFPNILAERYASDEMKAIWSPREKIIAERKLWVEILRLQQKIGVDIENKTIKAYEKVIEDVDFDSIAKREEVLQHDVKARIEEFSALAGEDGEQKIHLGLTSRDITENIEQVAIVKSAQLLADKARECLKKLNKKVESYKNRPIVARTHNVPAQLTTLGRIYAMFGEELMGVIKELEKFITEYKFRGIKGAIGTHLDSLALLEGDENKLKILTDGVIAYLSKEVDIEGGELKFTGQIYPRSLDLKFAQHLVQLVSAPANFAIDFRLMAGRGFVAERKPGGPEVGSTAMPHKVNPHLSERISGMSVLVKGYEAMLAGLSGNQWHEGDVSDSVVRRVVLSDICFAVDGLLNAYERVLEKMEVYKDGMVREFFIELPFLFSSVLVVVATKAGMGREEAHTIIQDSSTKARLKVEGTMWEMPELTKDTPLFFGDHPLVVEISEQKVFPLEREAMAEAIGINCQKTTIYCEGQADDYLSYAKEFLKSK